MVEADPGLVKMAMLTNGDLVRYAARYGLIA